tara:strand:- start:132 stop:479 length:348 start_codon:yes stop_codon:yes gene_type:complete
MEYLILAFGAKVACVITSIIGGLCNYNTKKVKSRKGTSGGHIKWAVERHQARKDLFLSLVIAVISVELFIPPLLHQFNLHVTLAPLLAFFIGYSGMRLLPAIEHKLTKFLDKVFN